MFQTSFRYVEVWILAGVVVFSALPAAAQWTNSQNAQYVVGQPDFTSWAQATTATGLNNPSGIAVDTVNSKLYIADSSNHRVLRYAYPLTGNTPSAELVFGQSNFTSGSANAGGAADASTLNLPSSCSVDATGRLWISDTDNHRVVYYNAAHAKVSNKPNADGVLGQADFTSASANRGGTVAQNTLSQPDGCFLHGTTLWVGDKNNHRVLRYDSAPSKGNGANADGVLGQPDFITAVGDTSQSAMYAPRYVACDGDGALYVSEYDSHRVIVFSNAAGKANGANADFLLGQLSWTSYTGETTQNILYNPNQICVDNANGWLFVADTNNRRALQFNSSGALPVVLSIFSIE